MSECHQKLAVDQFLEILKIQPNFTIEFSKYVWQICLTFVILIIFRKINSKYFPINEFLLLPTNDLVVVQSWLFRWPKRPNSEQSSQFYQNKIWIKHQKKKRRLRTNLVMNRIYSPRIWNWSEQTLKYRHHHKTTKKTIWRTVVQHLCRRTCSNSREFSNRTKRGTHKWSRRSSNKKLKYFYQEFSSHFDGKREEAFNKFWKTSYS